MIHSISELKALGVLHNHVPFSFLTFLGQPETERIRTESRLLGFFRLRVSIYWSRSFIPVPYSFPSKIQSELYKQYWPSTVNVLKFYSLFIKVCCAFCTNTHSISCNSFAASSDTKLLSPLFWAKWQVPFKNAVLNRSSICRSNPHTAYWILLTHTVSSGAARASYWAMERCTAVEQKRVLLILHEL